MPKTRGRRVRISDLGPRMYTWRLDAKDHATVAKAAALKKKSVNSFITEIVLPLAKEILKNATDIDEEELCEKVQEGDVRKQEPHLGDYPGFSRGPGSQSESSIPSSES